MVAAYAVLAAAAGVAVALWVAWPPPHVSSTRAVTGTVSAIVSLGLSLTGLAVWSWRSSRQRS